MTYGLGNRCSIQLSYGSKCLFYRTLTQLSFLGKVSTTPKTTLSRPKP